MTDAQCPVSLRQYLELQRDQMLRDLREIVESESPSSDPDALRRLARIVGEKFASEATVVTEHPANDGAVHLEARAGIEQDRRRPALVLCHLDTVHPIGALQDNPYRVAGGRAFGPGIQDMKAGIVLTLYALRALSHLDPDRVPPTVVLITSDEETGSASSRDLIARVARGCRFVLVPEAAGPGGAAKTARKGVAIYRLEVRGRAAHVGVDFDKGQSATVALARIVLELDSLGDPGVGTTINVGRIEGGGPANVVADWAAATVDVRFATDAEAQRVDRAIRNLAGRGSEAISVTGGINRPPLERTPESAALYERAREIAASLELNVGECSVGGASDGNLTSALGIPTLDGLGAMGAGMHTATEQIQTDDLPRRAALLAALLCEP